MHFLDKKVHLLFLKIRYIEAKVLTFQTQALITAIFLGVNVFNCHVLFFCTMFDYIIKLCITL